MGGRGGGGTEEVVLRGWEGWQLCSPRTERGGGGELNSVESGELAAFYSEIKAQEPIKRISRKLSRRFHASVIHHL